MDPLWSKRNWAKWWVSCFLPDAIEPRFFVTVVLLNPDTVGSGETDVNERCSHSGHS